MTATVDPSIIDALNQAQTATMTPQVVLASGAGKAYQMVAQACALAVQDAVDSLRNTNTLADTAAAAALSQLSATGDPQYVAILKATAEMKTAAVESFRAATVAAGETLKSFPAG
ncbi:MAG: hypothetical protein J7521_06350 [Caulobacter sp.]|nr:hypothetical protein [Caulobacter sp.]